MEVMRAQHEDDTATSQRPFAQDTDGTDPQLVTKGPVPPYGGRLDHTLRHIVPVASAVAPPGYTM
eukprot:4284968-Prymnesium_polylepis.1